MSIFTPVNQVRLTNVALVRLKRGGIRFELACYPNKVTSWRDKVETDIDEVLQSHVIFTNVSKGVVAKKDELKKAFGTDKNEDIITKILQSGEIQVSEKERQLTQEKLLKDIATIVAEKCIDLETKRPVTVGIVERAIKEVHFSVKPEKSAKSQALFLIRLLKDKIPIARAQMRLKVTMTAKDGRRQKEKLQPMIAVVEKEELTEEEFTLVGLIDPGSYRLIDDLVKNTKGGTIEVLTLAVQEEGEQKIE